MFTLIMFISITRKKIKLLIFQVYFFDHYYILAVTCQDDDLGLKTIKVCSNIDVNTDIGIDGRIYPKMNDENDKI